MCLEPDSLSSALACPLDLGARPTCRGLIALLYANYQGLPPGELCRSPWQQGRCGEMETRQSLPPGLAAHRHLSQGWAQEQALPTHPRLPGQTVGHPEAPPHSFHSWVGKIPWRRERLPTPVF